MGKTPKCILWLAGIVFLMTAIAPAQDAPSLGDLARQQRQQKDLSKDSKSKIITNADLPERSAPSPAPAQTGSRNVVPSQDGPKQPPEHWRGQILAQKRQIDSLQRQMDELSESIRFAPPNCVANCVGWNERQREKQQRVERMQAQLEEEKRRLDDMQDAARKQGYGSGVYDP